MLTVLTVTSELCEVTSVLMLAHDLHAEISLSAVIVVGYNHTNVNVFEADRQAKLIHEV